MLLQSKLKLLSLKTFLKLCVFTIKFRFLMNVPLPGELLISNAMIIFFSKFFQRNIKVTLISLSFFSSQCTFHNSWFFSGHKTHNDTCLFFSSKNEKRGDKQKAISLSHSIWTGLPPMSVRVSKSRFWTLAARQRVEFFSLFCFLKQKLSNEKKTAFRK